MNRGINDGENVPRELLVSLYERYISFKFILFFTRMSTINQTKRLRYTI